MDQNLLNFLPVGEHADVYKALSSHPEGEICKKDLENSCLLSVCFLWCHFIHCFKKKAMIFHFMAFSFNMQSCETIKAHMHYDTDTILSCAFQPRTSWNFAVTCSEVLWTPKSHRCMNTSNSSATSRHSAIVSAAGIFSIEMKLETNQW